MYSHGFTLEIFLKIFMCSTPYALQKLLCYNLSMLRSAPRRTPRRFIGKIFFFLCIVAIGGFFIRRQNAAVISPIPPETRKEPPHQIVLFAKKKDPQELRNMVQTTIGSTWKNYSVLAIDLNSNFEMGINDTVMYDAASVNKIPILAVLYYQAQQGSVELDKQITVQAEDIQDYGSGVIRYEEPGGTYSIKTLARLMMQQSDNTAAYLISAYVVPIDTIQKLITSWGLTQTDILNNKTSNKDIALLLSKVISGGIASQPLTQEMLAFLKNSAFEDRIPGNLPQSTTTYHKTGDAQGSLHDVGIVLDGKLRYYIGIFTSDITDEEETKKLIAKISRLVYDYLKQ